MESIPPWTLSIAELVFRNDCQRVKHKSAATCGDLPTVIDCVGTRSTSRAACSGQALGQDTKKQLSHQDDKDKTGHGTTSHAYQLHNCHDTKTNGHLAHTDRQFRNHDMIIQHGMNSNEVQRHM